MTGDAVGDWSEHDSAIWHTREIAGEVAAGQALARHISATPFPAGLGAGEAVVARARFELRTFRPVGDGGYRHDGGWLLATGRGGLALSAGAALWRSSENRRRREQALSDTVPRWVLDQQGTLWVSTHGFYLQTVGGLFPWPFEAVDSVMLVGPGSLHVQGAGSHGPTSWLLDLVWAELLLLLWARRRHPAHPQVAQGAWIPPGWAQRCSASGYDPERGLPAPS